MATRNPFAINPISGTRTVLLPEIRSRFRIISIVKPDIDQIFRVKCFEYNLKNSNVIAEKISLLYETVRLYLYVNIHFKFIKRKIVVFVDLLINVQLFL